MISLSRLGSRTIVSTEDFELSLWKPGAPISLNTPSSAVVLTSGSRTNSLAVDVLMQWTKAAPVRL
jgi:hypothetical protein